MRKFLFLTLVLLLMAFFSGCDTLDNIIPNVSSSITLDPYPVDIPAGAAGGLHQTEIDATTSQQWNDVKAKIKDIISIQITGDFKNTSSGPVDVKLYISDAADLTIDNVETTAIKLADVHIPVSDKYAYQSDVVSVAGPLENILLDGKFTTYAVCNVGNVKIDFLGGFAILTVKPKLI